MTCALERVKEIELLEENKVKFSPKLRAILKPEVYFEHCFGIIRQFEPITICFRAFWPQDAYLKDDSVLRIPIEVNHTEDYTDFANVRATYV